MQDGERSQEHRPSRRTEQLPPCDELDAQPTRRARGDSSEHSSFQIGPDRLRNPCPWMELPGSEIIKNQKDKVLFNPEIRIYNQPKILTSEADIKSSILEDKFIVINLVKGQEYFNVRYQVKSFMIWIWLSTLIIIIGGFASLIKKYK